MKKRIIKSRHKILLKEQLDFTYKKEEDMGRKLGQRLSIIFPDAVERRNYILSFIKGLDRDIAKGELC